MRVLKFPQETDPMPTMNDIYQLAVDTNARVDSLGDKLTSLEDEVRNAVKTLMDAFTQRADA